MHDIWVLAADTHKARVFKTSMPGGKQFIEIRSFVEMDTALPEREIVSDSPGHYQSGSQGHPKLPRTSAHEKRVQAFARDVAHFLEEEYKKGEFYKLGIVAAPHMLGELRLKLSDTLQKELCFELDKNLTHLSAHHMKKHLSEQLQHPSLH